MDDKTYHIINGLSHKNINTILRAVFPVHKGFADRIGVWIENADDVLGKGAEPEIFCTVYGTNEAENPEAFTHSEYIIGYLPALDMWNIIGDDGNEGTKQLYDTSGIADFPIIPESVRCSYNQDENTYEYFIEDENLFLEYIISDWDLYREEDWIKDTLIRSWKGGVK